MKKYPRITNDMACLALHKEFILDSLLKMQYVNSVGNKYEISELGRLVTRLFIKPSTAKVLQFRIDNINSEADILETIADVHTVERNRPMDQFFVQSMIQIINRPSNMPIIFRIREVSEKYFKGLGDIEEFVAYTKWMIHSLMKIAEFFGYQQVKKYAQDIIKKLNGVNN